MIDFWNRMEKVSQVMTSLENEHKRDFSHDEELKLINYKENFVKSCIFYNDAEITTEEKIKRITWEYNNMFDRLVEIIDNNVEEWEDVGNNEHDSEQDF